MPNGADPAAVPYTPPAQRALLRRALGAAAGDRLAVFVGSWHEPNIVALRELIHLAPQLDGWRVLVLGSCGLAVAGEPMPAAIDICGVVDQRFLRATLAIADAALNPMRLGSGTNLKMLDYALAGVPLVSTRFGARGLGLSAGEHYAECEPDDLGAALAGLAATDPAAIEARVVAARTHVVEHFSWDRIAGDWLATPALTGLLEPLRVGA